MNPYYTLVSSRAKYRCEYCRAPESVFNFPFEVEHLVPPAQGGSDESSNLALACRSCNLYKGSFIYGDDPLTGLSHTLFNPRTDDWKQHFQVNSENGEIVGLTPIGRATVLRLKMNSRVQLQVRQQWMRLKVFP